jgi:hypothetical protein
MRAIRIALFASLAATLAACGGGSEKEPDAMVIPPDAAPDAPPDAPPETANLSCVGNSQPAAAANVTLSGFAAEVVVNGVTPDITPAHSATIDICKASSTTCLNTDRLDQKTTAPNGCPATGCPFTSASLATNGSPLDVYAKITKGTTLPTYVYPQAPVVANVTNIPGVLLTTGAVSALAGFGVIEYTAGQGLMLVALTDCANMPLTAMTNVVVKQGGTVVAAEKLDLGSFDPSLAGTFIISNLPAGPDAQNPSVVTEISGTYKTTTLRTHEVRVFRDSVTATQLRPGF